MSHNLTIDPLQSVYVSLQAACSASWRAVRVLLGAVGVFLSGAATLAVGFTLALLIGLAFVVVLPFLGVALLLRFGATLVLGDND